MYDHDFSDGVTEEDWAEVEGAYFEAASVLLQESGIHAELHHLEGYRIEHDALKRQLAAPPAPWVTFGSHVDQPDVALEFWGDEGGVPLWEREVDHPSAKERLTKLRDEAAADAATWERDYGDSFNPEMVNTDNVRRAAYDIALQLLEES